MKLKNALLLWENTIYNKLPNSQVLFQYFKDQWTTQVRIIKVQSTHEFKFVLANVLKTDGMRLFAQNALLVRFNTKWQKNFGKQQIFKWKQKQNK